MSTTPEHPTTTPPPGADGRGVAAPSLDEGALAALREVSDDFLAQVVAHYLGSMPTLFESMLCAVRDGDVKGLHRAAHDAKSNSATVGATRLAAVFKEIESRTASGSVDGVAGRLEEAAAELPGVYSVLQRHVPGRSPV